MVLPPKKGLKFVALWGPLLHRKSKFSSLRTCWERDTPPPPPLPPSHLEHLGEEARSDLLPVEVVQASEAGDGAAQGPVRRRPDPVGSVDAVQRRLGVPRLLRLQLHLSGRRRTRDVRVVLKSSPAPAGRSHV